LLSHVTLLHGAVPQTILPDSARTVLAPAWSISIEWQYYLLAPFIARWVRSVPGLIFLALVAWLAPRFTPPGWAFMPTQLPFFLIGIASYHLYATFCSAGGQPSRRNLVLVAASLGAAVLMGWNTITLVIWFLAFGSLFSAGEGAFATTLRGVRAFLAHPVLEWLGRVSYPLYLIHYPLIVIFLAGILRLKPTASRLETVTCLFLIGLPLILGAAHLLHKWVEAPGMRISKRFTRVRPAPQPVIVPGALVG
jgi:peptidoglycan/LPS O-acetylase OafA/YrhL